MAGHYFHPAAARWLGWVAGRRRQAKGSVSRWAKLQPVRRVLADPRFAALNPGAHREIVQVDVAEEVCARLRLGSLREYTWPAFEETVAGKTFDPTFFFTPDHTTPHPGSSLSPASIPAEWFSFSSTLTRTTPNSCDSPLGDENDTHYCIMFGGNPDEGTTLFSPLGQFSGPFVLCTAMKRPGDGTWIVSNELVDAATNLPITPAPTPLSAAHLLEWLPLQALHYLRVRNLDVSRKMRACTVSDATRLLAEPEAVHEFMCGDVVFSIW